VLKSLGNGPDDVKSERLPKSHGGVVRFHNGVELHRGVSLLASPRERVLAERTSDPPASRVAGDHEARGGDVRARTGTVRSHLRRPEHPGAVAGYNRVTRRSLYPHVLGLLGRPFRVVNESVASSDDLPEDGPDGRPVGVNVFTNPHYDILIEAPNQIQSKTIPPLDALPPEIKLLSPFFTLPLKGRERAEAGRRAQSVVSQVRACTP
jgi:hypothetical protein